MSNRYSPVLIIEPGPATPVLCWLLIGFSFAALALIDLSWPAPGALTAGCLLLAGLCHEWRYWGGEPGPDVVRRLRWGDSRWWLQTPSGGWQHVTLVTGRCRFLWGARMCWRGPGGDKKSAFLFDRESSADDYRRFRVRLRLENIA